MTIIADLRRASIIEYFQNTTQAGTREVATDLDIPYATLRRMLLELETEGVITPAGYSHGNGGVTYKIKGSTPKVIDPMPKFSSFGQKLTLVDYVKQFAARARFNGGKFTSDGINDATHVMAVAMATLLKLAQDEHDNGNIDIKKLKGARNSLLQVEKTFSDMAELVKQVLNCKELWQVDLLASLVESESWDSNEIIEAYNNLTIKVAE